MQEALREQGEQREADVEGILRRWGFDGAALKEALCAYRDPNGPRATVLNMGTVALDVKYEGPYENHPLMGDCALVDLQNRMPDGTEFKEPPDEDLRRAHAGGLGNDANAVARVLANERERVADTIPGGVAETRHHVWEVMARMGRGETGTLDRVGGVYVDKISDLIGKDLLRPDQVHKWSGLSRIWVQDRDVADVAKGERAIIFRAGASGATMPTKEDRLEILVRRTVNSHLAYPGLFLEGMDRDDGVEFDRFVRDIQEVCPIVSLDTHGPTQLSHIDRPLSHIDMANFNLADAVRLFTSQKIDPKKEPSRGVKQQLRALISTELFPYFENEARKPRMFTVTDKEGCYLIFQGMDGTIHISYLDSPCAAIKSVDKTGAGDVRYGFQRLYIAREMAREWRSGSFEGEDAKCAVQIGQIAATLHVQGQGANAFDGVTLAMIERVAKEGKTFDSIGALRSELLRA